MSDIITIELEAMEPETLVATSTGNIWIRNTGKGGMGAMMELRGPRDEVLAFIRAGWGEEEADYWQTRGLAGARNERGPELEVQQEVDEEAADE